MPANQRSLRLLDGYHERLIALRGATSRLVVSRYRAVDANDLSQSLRLFVGDAAQIITQAHNEAATLSRAFLRSYAASEKNETLGLEERVETGTTSDGRNIGEAMGAIPAKVFLAIKQGQSPERALAFGLFAAKRFADTEVMEAAGQELKKQMDASDLISAWRVKSRGTCGACLATDNGVSRTFGQQLPPFHPGCSCVAEPVVRGVRQEAQRPTGHERFEQMTEADQDEALGKSIADRLRSGAVAWGDLVSTERPHEWHPLLVAATLAEVEQRS